MESLSSLGPAQTHQHHAFPEGRSVAPIQPQKDGREAITLVDSSASAAREESG